MSGRRKKSAAPFADLLLAEREAEKTVLRLARLHGAKVENNRRKKIAAEDANWSIAVRLLAASVRLYRLTQKKNNHVMEAMKR